ncbi:global transactivator [Fusarium langsethiae]|uniref:Global transactivator n=1 Tax=Fusarium langsethiae TaxID=179993 RepID=A0A0M9EXS8_FUSLA|nr:global transactivator [Fusarium langsethiae]GKU03026.1 unnamed protein product [Fusarium langsethiae]GKU19097.1 unnamed protein product [Fusarium langsethiae]
MRRNLNMDAIEDHEATDQFVKWKERLERDENWLSPRVEAITEIIGQQNDRYADHSYLIVDEIAYFLDIVAVAIGTGTEQSQ